MTFIILEIYNMRALDYNFRILDREEIGVVWIVDCFFNCLKLPFY